MSDVNREEEPGGRTNRFTTLHLALLLHYHGACGLWPHPRSIGVAKCTEDLVMTGLVLDRARFTPAGGYDTTEKGKAYIRALCTTSLPVEKMVLVSTWVVDGEGSGGGTR